MKNQLFRKEPSDTIINKVLQCFKIYNIDKTAYFTKDYLKNINVLDNMKDIIYELEEYYLPCKSKIYLNNLTEKKIITILRQLIKLKNYYIISKETFINNRKVIIYSITKISINNEIKDRTIVF